jgi:hypothetical protein
MTRKLIQGVNDLKTLFPAIADDAYGWDPSQCLSGVKDKKDWICHKGHIWITDVNHRTSSKTGCPYCAGKKPVKGLTDTATLFPLIAREALDWDPSEYLPQSNKRKLWICSFGHTWEASIYMRTNRNTGCPFCNIGGYCQAKEGWLYLLSKQCEQKIGISNNLKGRLRTHRRNGWTTVETLGPISGNNAWLVEKTVKTWLKENSLLVPGTQENWSKNALTISSLNEIFTLAGVASNLLRG